MLVALALLGVPSAGPVAQTDPRAAVLGQLLAAEDRRSYDPALFEAALRSPDPVVRRQATLGAGRIQDSRAGAPLLAMLASADTSGHADAMFALGLLGDSSVAGKIVARLGDPRSLSNGAVIEAAGTLAKLGTGLARTLFSKLLDGTDRSVPAARRDLMIPELLVEGWRFGRYAPVRAALPWLEDRRDAVRWKAAYLLGRTRAALGVRGLLAASRDAHPWVRQQAMRGLTRGAADSAGVARDSVVAVLVAGLRDADAGVRVNGLASLATWQDSTTTADVAGALGDAIPNVRMQAIMTLGGLPGAEARAVVLSVASNRELPLALRREALVAMLRSDTAAVVIAATGLLRDSSPRARLLGIELSAAARRGDGALLMGLLRDRDFAVRNAAVNSLGVVSPELDAATLALATAELDHPNPLVRNTAWSVYGRRAASAAAVETLVTGWQREVARGAEGTTAPILAALRRLHLAGGAGAAAVDSLFVQRVPAPENPQLRQSAGNWPALAARWGRVTALPVRYTAAEYEALAARWLLAPAGSSRVVVSFETEGKGRVEVELLGDQAPLTVANFLGLVERGAFDGGEWHRVVPNFVVQDGAGPTSRPIRGLLPIRDEFNRVRYDTPVLGMALSGPNTGTSQWFINLSPQPHLDGGYTVFGRVLVGEEALAVILQGDLIRAITRR